MKSIKRDLECRKLLLDWEWIYLKLKQKINKPEDMEKLEYCWNTIRDEIESLCHQ